MITIQEQEKLFIEIGKTLDKKIECFAIGGTALMFLGLKDSTKDIDLVFSSKEDRTAFIKAAKNAGWLELDARIVYGERENIPIMLKFGDSRLDLFVNEVIDFSFSKQMRERAEKIRQFEKN